MSFAPANNGEASTPIPRFPWLHSYNATDRMLTAWYLLLTIALLTRNRPSFAGYFFLHSLILATILVVSRFSDHGRWWRLAHDWYPTLVFVAAFEETARLSLAFLPRWQDAFLLHAEAAIFPVPPTLWLGRIHSFWITELLEFGYFTFYWIMFVVGGALYEGVWSAKSSAEVTDARQRFGIWMDATVLCYIVCYVVYLLFPTEGPAHTLPRELSSTFTGPFRWLVQLIQHHAGVHGNAFPSAHIMASIVALIAAGKWKPRLARWLALPVLLMCVGAVYDGYHYVTDVLAGALLGAFAFWFVNAIQRSARDRSLPRSIDAG